MSRLRLLMLYLFVSDIAGVCRILPFRLRSYITCGMHCWLDECVWFGVLVSMCLGSYGCVYVDAYVCVQLVVHDPATTISLIDFTRERLTVCAQLIGMDRFTGLMKLLVDPAVVRPLIPKVLPPQMFQ